MTTIALLMLTAATAYAWGHTNGTNRSAIEINAAREQGWQEGYVQGFANGHEDAEVRRVMARTLSQLVRETAEWN